MLDVRCWMLVFSGTKQDETVSICSGITFGHYKRQVMKSLLPMLLALVWFPASARGDRPNSNCEWLGETAVSLDLSKSGQQQHLADDAQSAEDLAIRYADSHSGPRSGHFAGFDEYRRTREQCMAALFAVIADT